MVGHREAHGVAGALLDPGDSASAGHASASAPVRRRRTRPRHRARRPRDRGWPRRSRPRTRGRARRPGPRRVEREDRAGLGHGPPADLLRDELRLPRGRAHVARLRANLGRCLCLDGGHYRLDLPVAGMAAEDPRRANSPSLCPTMPSVTKIGTCLRPSWTAIVWPTISGKTVDARDQVRIGCFWPDSFICWTRPCDAPRRRVPFFDDLLT